MPTRREEDEALAAHRAGGSAAADPGWYPDPVDPTREWRWDGSRWTGRYRRKRIAAPGWYPDPAFPSREWHWDGLRWSGRHREKALRTDFASVYSLLPTWAQVTIPIVVLIGLIGVFAGDGENGGDTQHPGGDPIEREEQRRQLELEHLSMGAGWLQMPANPNSGGIDDPIGASWA
ncbi:MAG TPA: hypothetical protein VIT85_06345 [Solirubrobacterales bacterium]